jgi:hypothetical protein
VLVWKAGTLISLSKWLVSFDVKHLQQLGPDGTKTLLDHHLATFDAWLQVHFMSLFPSSQSYYCLTVVTLLDQLDSKEYNWMQHPVILEDLFISDNLLDLIDRMKTNIEFSQIVSKFLMDRKRAGLFWVNSQKYADLARYLLEFLHNKCVYSPYTLICTNKNA